MTTTKAIELTESETHERDALIAAVARAFTILGLEAYRVGTYGDVLRAAGVDPIVAEIGARWFGSEVTVYGRIASTFRIETDVCFTLSCSDSGSWHVEAEVKWASGGGSVSSALAQAEHHMTMIRRMAAAEETVREAARKVRGNRAHVMTAAGETAQRVAELAHATIKAHVDSTKKA
jgi:hypothetical protein